MIWMTLSVLLLHSLVGQGTPVQWRQLGPWGSTCDAVAVKPNDGRVAYVGTGMGLYRTETTGQSWRQVTGGLPGNPPIAAIAIDPLLPQSVAYVGLKGQGAYKTTNDGSTWNPVNNGLNRDTCFSIAVSPLTPGLLYAGTEDGVFRSTNGGASWVLSGLSRRHVYSLDHDPETFWRIYAGTDQGMYRRSISGTWNPINNGLPSNPLPEVYSVKVDSHTTNVLLAGGQPHVSNHPYVYKSTDYGDSWITFGEENGLQIGGWVNAVCIHVPSVYYVATGPNGVYETTDGGDHWTQINTGLPGGPDFPIPSCLSLAASPAGRRMPVLFCGLEGYGVFTRVVGSDSWIPFRNGLASSSLGSVYVMSGDANRVYAGYGNPDFAPQSGQNCSRTTDGGFTWISTSLRVTTYSYDFDPSDPLRGFAGTVGSWTRDYVGTVERTLDGGDTWTTVLSPEGDRLGAFAAVRVRPVGGRSGTIVYAGHSSPALPGPVYKSEDGGTNWSVSYLGAVTDIYDIDVLPGSAETAYDTVYVGSGNGVYRSTNGGSTWNNIGLNGLPVRDLGFVLPNYHIFAGVYGHGVYKSTDGGFTWEPKNNGLTDLTVQALAVDPGSWVGPSTQVEIYVGTSSGGVFYSSNGGDSWTPTNTGSSCLDICDIFIRSTYGVSTIYVATCGHNASGISVHSVEH